MVGDKVSARPTQSGLRLATCPPCEAFAEPLHRDFTSPVQPLHNPFIEGRGDNRLQRPFTSPSQLRGCETSVMAVFTIGMGKTSGYWIDHPAPASKISSLGVGIGIFVCFWPDVGAVRKVRGGEEIGGDGGCLRGGEKVVGWSYGVGRRGCCEEEFGGEGRLVDGGDRGGYRRGCRE